MAGAIDPSGGAWTVTSGGAVESYGGAPSFGSTSPSESSHPIVGMAATGDGGGYWLVASDGGVFAFGDAGFHGSTGGIRLNKPIVGIAATEDGGGYWLVASDGGVFAFGDAGFHGSTGAMRLDAPIVGMSAMPDSGGYWLVGADGGIFSFGDALYQGRPPTTGETVTGLVSRGGIYGVIGAPGGVSSPDMAGLMASSATTSNTVTLTPPPGYSGLAFDDEFSGSSLDSSKWNVCYPWASCTNAANHEQELYQKSQCQTSGGQLHLVAQQQQNATYPYASCLVNTDKHFNFTYGYVQVRAQMPSGQGLWPALWLVPSDYTWPPEIDIMEMIGQRTQTLVTTYHPPTGPSAQSNYYGADLTGWHTYGLAWAPGVITWYIDGQQVFRTTANVTAKSMYLIMNLAVGGSWPGSVSAATPASASMNVDWVRIWR